MTQKLVLLISMWGCLAFLKGDYRRLINEGNVPDYADDTMGCTNHEKAAMSVY